MSLPRIALLALEKVLNSALKLDSQTHTRVLALAGKMLEVDVRGLAAPFYVAFTTDGLRLAPSFPTGAHARICGAPLDMLRSAVTKDRTSVFSGDVVIEGDAELVQRVQSLLGGLDIDWEEQLSRFMGDIASHQIASMVRTAQSRLLGAGRSLSQDAAEFITEEQRILPTRFEVDRFLCQVDDLRADADRTAQRVERLRALLEAKSA